MDTVVDGRPAAHGPDIAVAGGHLREVRDHGHPLATMDQSATGSD